MTDDKSMGDLENGIICNGSPKSGTHALLRILECFGYTQVAFAKAFFGNRTARLDSHISDSDSASKTIAETLAVHDDASMKMLLHANMGKSRMCHSHISYVNRGIVEDYYTVTIFRHPRDQFLSYLRWKNIDVSRLEDHTFDIGYFVAAYLSFEGWEKRPFVIYETLHTEETVLRLARALGKMIPREEARRIINVSYGNSRTWTGSPINAERMWNEKIEEYWSYYHGEDLVGIYESLCAQQ